MRSRMTDGDPWGREYNGEQRQNCPSLMMCLTTISNRILLQLRFSRLRSFTNRASASSRVSDKTIRLVAMLSLL
jgi:hypothetical protein